MESIKNNKKIILVCIGLILIVLSLVIIKKINNKPEEFSTENYEYLKNYESNEYVPLYIKEEDIVKKYLNEYKNNMLYNIEEAYNSLNRNYRVKRFGNIEEYKKYVSEYSTEYINAIEVDIYSKSVINGYKVFDVYDKKGNQYIIKEVSIMNYEIYLDLNTVTIE